MAGELIGILSEANQEIPQELIEMAERFDKMKQRKALESGGGRGYGGGRGGGYRDDRGSRGGRNNYDGGRRRDR